MRLTKLQIQNYRGIKSLELDLDETTVIIGENNCGKTSVLHVLRSCLSFLKLGARSAPFEEFDLHFDSKAADPTTVAPIQITLTFEEKEAGEWPIEIEQKLGGDGGIIVFISPNDRSRIQLKVTAQYSAKTKELEHFYDFLDSTGNPLPSKNRGKLTVMQQMRPLFYLSALRDAAKEFSKTSQFWSPFVKNSQIDTIKKDHIEKRLEEINAEIIEAHVTFKDVKVHLDKINTLVNLGTDNVVSIDAIPAKIFDMLNKTQVSLASATGAKLPINRHGEGTQSLSVLMLFDAFLKAELARRQGATNCFPIVALEEPEAHLHPCAIRALWKTIKDINGQKVIATHSGDLLAVVDTYMIRRLYKRNGQTKVGAIPLGLITGRNKQKFDFLVQRTRAELFFARVWLLVEGETESIIFAGAAEVLDLDLEQAGVRTVEYRQGDISYFIQAANGLGISWHCFCDEDSQGETDIRKAVDRLPTAAKQKNHITKTVGSCSIEPFLARNGFIEIYKEIASPQKIKNITCTKNDTDYIDAVCSCITAKPEAAHRIVEAMRQKGSDSVPKQIKLAIYKAIALARRS
jgi:putative ATP-dependent endonuclease of the OLD family